MATEDPERDALEAYAPVPEEGSPEWRALVERQKEEVEGVTGVRPDVLLDVGPSDDPQVLRRRRS